MMNQGWAAQAIGLPLMIRALITRALVTRTLIPRTLVTRNLVTRTLITGALVTGMTGMFGIPQVMAQTAGNPIGDCLPPAANEFLLFAVARTVEAQAVLRSKAPTDATTTLCRYQGEMVMRVGGFASEPSAAAWGQYLIRATGIPTTIVRPVVPATLPTIPGSSLSNPVIPTAPANPIASSNSNNVSNSNSSSNPKINPGSNPNINSNSLGSGSVGKRFAPGIYQPQTLSSGYAVLVNYNNRPEVSVQLSQVLSQGVGVAAYGARPYLFVTQTNEVNAANALVKLLTDRGFLALRVEAKSVVLLRSAPSVKP